MSDVIVADCFELPRQLTLMACIVVCDLIDDWSIPVSIRATLPNGAVIVLNYMYTYRRGVTLYECSMCKPFVSNPLEHNA